MRQPQMNKTKDFPNGQTRIFENSPMPETFSTVTFLSALFVTANFPVTAPQITVSTENLKTLIINRNLIKKTEK